TVRVVRAYGAISPGDRVIRLELPSHEDTAPSGRTLSDNPGMIVEVQQPRFLIGQRNVVYLDWGREEGLQLGDRLEVCSVGDRLRINLDELVDHVEFESGEATFKPEGLRILKQVSEILKAVPDKHFRVEGHADNVPIGPSLKEKFPSNWELSKARATSVVRYLIEEGGLDSASLSAVGYGDTRPAASNETEEGRQ